MRVTRVLGTIVIVMLTMSITSAQKFGIRAGLNLSTILQKDDFDTYSNDYSLKPGFHFGGIYEQELSDAFSLQSGLIFESKGTSVKEDDLGIDVSVKLNPLYLTVPLAIKGQYGFSDNFAMFGSVGPSLSLGVGGKIIGEVSSGGDKEITKEEISWGSDELENDIRRFDMGISFAAGVLVSGVEIGIAYDLGLVNISSYQDEGTVIRNRNLRFYAAYTFGSGGGRYPW